MGNERAVVERETEVVGRDDGEVVVLDAQVPQRDDGEAPLRDAAVALRDDGEVVVRDPAAPLREEDCRQHEADGAHRYDGKCPPCDSAFVHHCFEFTLFLSFFLHS